MKKLFILLFGTISLLIFSQTKLIAYKSHSGNMKNFAATIADDAFETTDSNLGAAPNILIKTAKLDSVIYVNENESILVTSSTCKTRNGQESKWKPGRETVYNNKLFSSKNTDSIKSVLKNTYNFQNDMDKVKFINFQQPSKKELRKIKKEQKKSIKTKNSTSENSTNHSGTPYYLGLILLTSLAGVYSYRKKK